MLDLGDIRDRGSAQGHRHTSHAARDEAEHHELRDCLTQPAADEEDQEQKIRGVIDGQAPVCLAEGGQDHGPDRQAEDVYGDGELGQRGVRYAKLVEEDRGAGHAHGRRHVRDQGEQGDHDDVCPLLAAGPVLRVVGVVWTIPVDDVGVACLGLGGFYCLYRDRSYLSL